MKNKMVLWIDLETGYYFLSKIRCQFFFLGGCRGQGGPDPIFQNAKYNWLKVRRALKQLLLFEEIVGDFNFWTSFSFANE